MNINFMALQASCGVFCCDELPDEMINAEEEVFIDWIEENVWDKFENMTTDKLVTKIYEHAETIEHLVRSAIESLQNALPEECNKLDLLSLIDKA